MRIAMISAGRTGTQDGHVAHLAAALTNLGHQVSRHAPNPAPVATLGRFGQRLAARWAEHGAPDVVHVHSWMDCVVALAATRLPLVMTAHELDPAPQTAVCGAADRLIALSGSQAGSLSQLVAGPGRIEVIPPGVDIERFRPGSVTVHTGPLQRILAVGMSPADGLASLIRALPQLPEAELVIAGGPEDGGLADDPDALGLLTLARELWVDSRVLLLGNVPAERMPALYRSADVLASVRVGGGPSAVFQEAMACGVPVVGYRGEGTARTVVDGRTGVLLPPGDIYGVTQALSAVLGDRMTRAHWGNAARRRAEEQFTWTQVANQVAQVYRDAIGSTQYSQYSKSPVST